MRRCRRVQKPEAELRATRPCHEPRLQLEPRPARKLDGNRHKHPRTDTQRALNMTGLVIEGPNGAPSDHALLREAHRAGKGEVFAVAGPRRRPHAATL